MPTFVIIVVYCIIVTFHYPKNCMSHQLRVKQVLENKIEDVVIVKKQGKNTMVVGKEDKVLQQEGEKII